MKRSVALVHALSFVLLAACQVQQTPSARSFPDAPRELFILNSLAETISVYDADSGVIHNDAVTTGSWPNDIYYRADRLYVINSGDNSIWVYDESSLEKIAEIYLGKNRNPWTIIPAGDGPKAYVPNWVSGSVSIVDVESYELLGEIEGVGAAPEGGCYANGKIYVCCTGYTSAGFGEGSVTVIDTASDTVITKIPTGPETNPQTAIAIPGAHTIHVVLSGPLGAGEGAILAIDTDTNTVIGQAVPIGGEPSIDPQALDESGEIAYLSGNGGVMAYDYTTFAIIAGPTDPVYGTGDIMNSYSSVVYRNNILYVADFNGDRIAVTNLITGETENIEGSDGPQELIFTEE